MIFPCRRRVSLWWWLWGIATAGIAIHHFIEFLEEHSAYNIVFSAIWAVCIPATVLRIRQESHRPFIILTHTAGYGQRCDAYGLVAFPEVVEATETASSLKIRHVKKGWRAHSNPTIPRHQFAAEDWEQIVSILLDRIRSQSPDATIRTALHPEG